MIRSAPESKLSLWIAGLLAVGLVIIISLPSDLQPHLISAHYNPVHTTLEFIGILLSFMIFSVGWATFNNVRSPSILLLSVSGLVVGALDIGHALSYNGMPDFITPNNPSKAIYFWLAARFTDALILLLVPLIPMKTQIFKRYRLQFLALGTLWTIAWFYVILFSPETLPGMFTQEAGLAPVKVLIEYIIIVLLAIASLVYFVRADENNERAFRWLGIGCLVFVMSELMFTFYRSVNDVVNFFGHVYKVITFVFIYRAVFIECVSAPYEEMKRLAQETKIANETKTQFLANVSHEFRTPLGILVGFSDLLLSSKQLDREGQEWLTAIKRNAEQLGLLIDDLLDLTKIETGQIAVQRLRFSLDEVIETVIGGLRLPAQEKGIQLQVTKAENVPHSITSDPNRFRQILLNVVGNAVKFTEKGTVEVRIETVGADPRRELKVSVQDTGIGISFEQEKRLFKPFSQGDDSMSRRFGGTGLGLALSKKLASLLGGDLWLDRSRPGQGSVFCFTIALEIGDEQQQPQHHSEPVNTEPTSISGRRILVVEDSADNRFLLHRYLTLAGASVTTAANGREGVEQALANQFDLIIMDIQMPEVDGYQATQMLRETGCQLPIIALTAHALQKEKHRALATGFNDYLVKPVKRQVLIRTIGEWCATLSPKTNQSRDA